MTGWLAGGPNGVSEPPNGGILTLLEGRNTPKRGNLTLLGVVWRGILPGRRPTGNPKMTVLRVGQWSGPVVSCPYMPWSRWQHGPVPVHSLQIP